MKHMMSKGSTSATLSGRSELIFPDESIDFCARDSNNINLVSYPSNSSSERRRRGHGRRSNPKLEVEQQVKWTRQNIASTMERFEPSYNIDYTPTSPTTLGLAIDTPTAVASLGTSMQQSPINHVYSYAYYEPGTAKCHTNIPQKDSSINSMPGPSKSPPRNSIRALLAKGFRSKAINNANMTSCAVGDVGDLAAGNRHRYKTHNGTQNNVYEEVDEQKIRKVLSDNRIMSENSSVFKEELRRVQHHHFRVLDELNLSLEALIMPSTPLDISPTVAEKKTSHLSMENLPTVLNSKDLKDHTRIYPEFDGDLDSGFSSSGASYNKSFRNHKASAVMQVKTLPHMRSYRSTTSKSSMNSDQDQDICSDGSNNGDLMATTSSPFNYPSRCTDSQRSSTSSSGGVVLSLVKDFVDSRAIIM